MKFKYIYQLLYILLETYKTQYFLVAFFPFTTFYKHIIKVELVVMVFLVVLLDLFLTHLKFKNCHLVCT